MKNSKKRFILIVITLLVAIISSLIIYIVRTDYYNSFIMTEGVVTDIEWLNNTPAKYARIHRGLKNLGSDATFRIYFTYEVDDTVYDSNDLSYKNVSKYRVGDTIDVWYAPNYPQNSFPYKPSPALEVFIPLFLAFPVIIGIANLKRHKKGRALFDE